MKLSDLNLLDVGHSIQLAGALYADGENIYLMPLPGELTEDQLHNMNVTVIHAGSLTRLFVLDMDREDWARFIRQTDLLEVEIMAHQYVTGNRKLAKAIIRKSNRQIAQGVSWRVYRRDCYKCRYCSADDVPLTVDHLVLWENGGPSIEANLVAACRKCNKVRGNKPYHEWLIHPYYMKVCRNLTVAAACANEALADTLDAIPRQVHKPSKR